jgi:hypothetical protein
VSAMSLGTDDATADFIQRHLDDDLEGVAQTSNQQFIRPSLAPFLSSDGLLQLPLHATATATAVRLVLQVMSVKDVSLSREQRCRALVRAADLASGDAVGSGSGSTDGPSDDPAAVVDATLQAVEDQNDEAGQQQAPLRPSGGQWRCLRLELSDGFQRVLAVEDVCQRTLQQCGGVLAPGGLALGSKLVVRLSASARPVVQHGVLRLHAGNTEVLGGHVRALEEYWQALARQQLAASTGRPSRRQHQQVLQQHPSPPPPTAPNSSSTQRSASASIQPPPPSLSTLVSSLASTQHLLVQPLRQWPLHVAQNPPQTPFATVAFITEVVSDMVINESLPAKNSGSDDSVFTYALLAQLSSPDAVERDTQPPQDGDTAVATEVTEDDHLTVDLGHTWLRQLVGMPASDFRTLSLSIAAADVARLTSIVEAVGQALEQFGKRRFILMQRASDGIVEVVKAEPEG